MKNEDSYVQTDLAGWTASLLAKMAKRIGNGKFNSQNEQYLENLRRIEIAEGRTIRPKHGNQVDVWDGYFSPAQRNRIDKLRLEWIRAGGEKETYQQFYDNLLAKAQEMAEAMVKDRESKAVEIDDKVMTEVETKSDSNRAVSDSGLNDSEAIMSDNSRTRTL